MNIGEKIKKLRNAKMMTQSELVGTEITRNMLSRIENGTATPSLETVMYIASRLNVSAGYLLADESDEQIYIKHNEVLGIKRTFMNADHYICRDMCIHSSFSDDDEIKLILAECELAIGIEEFCRGALRSCCEHLDSAVEACGGTLYRTDHIVSAVGVYFRYMRLISATLSSSVIDEDEINIYPSLSDDFCRYAVIFERMSENSDTDTEGIEKIGNKDYPLNMHIEAKRYMQSTEYSEAYKRLREILVGECSVPEPVLYFVFCDLEICCREMQDFKGAYEYSLNKIELLQKLLT